MIEGIPAQRNHSKVFPGRNVFEGRRLFNSIGKPHGDVRVPELAEIPRRRASE